MTLTLLNLYNSAASQEWSMYDNDASGTNEFEDSLVTALNKAILEIYSSYNFPFRERTHLILTMPNVSVYDLPQGLIQKDKDGNYQVKHNSQKLMFMQNTDNLEEKYGLPEYFYIKSNKLYLYPIPSEKGMVTIDYLTLSIGENSSGNEIFTLSDASDTLYVPAYLEQLMKEAIITKTMLNTIASESDENFSAYKKQADKSYKLLIKYSKIIEKDKKIKI